MKREYRISDRFRITIKYPETLEHGNTGRFLIELRDSDNKLFDPSLISFSVYFQNVQKLYTSPTKSSTGVYYTDYAVDTSESTGTRECEYGGSVDNVPFCCRFTFESISKW